MKAEHRKELQTNVLADSMGRLVQSVKSGSNTTLTVVAIVVLVIVGLAATWWILATTSANKRSNLWVKLDEASSADALQKLAADNPGTMPGRIARFEQARSLLRQGEQQLFSELRRDSALKSIQEAQGLYDKLAAESGDVPILDQEALMGAGRARECQGDVAGASEYYDRLAKRYPTSTLGKKAAELVAAQQQRQELATRLQQLAEAKSKSP